jgi:hypothetical protein
MFQYLVKWKITINGFIFRLWINVLKIKWKLGQKFSVTGHLSVCYRVFRITGSICCSKHKKCLLNCFHNLGHTHTHTQISLRPNFLQLSNNTVLYSPSNWWYLQIRHLRLFTVPEGKWQLVGVCGAVPIRDGSKISNSEYNFIVIQDEGCYGLFQHTCVPPHYLTLIKTEWQDLWNRCQGEEPHSM